MEKLRVQINQKLRITVFSSIAVNISLRAQFSMLDGSKRQVPFDAPIIVTTPQADRTARNFDFPLSDEILDFFTLQMNTAGIQRGQCFVRAAIIYSNTAYVQEILFQDYLTSKGYIGYPYSRITSPSEGNGYIHLQSLGTQTRGQDLTYVVPAGCLMKLQSLTFIYNASNVGANRQLEIFFNTVGGTVVPSAISQFQQAGNTIAEYYFSSLFPSIMNVYDAVALHAKVIEPLPNVILSGDTYDSISISAVNIDSSGTGDIITYAFMRIEEWIKD